MRNLLAIFLTVILAACGQEMSVSTVLSDARGLDEGAPVFLDSERVGEVSSVSAGSELTEARLSLDPALAAGLRSGSAARLASREGRVVVEVHNYRSGAKPLADGDELRGLNNTLEYAAWRSGEAMDIGRQSVDGMSESIVDYFNSDEWRRHKQRVNRRLAELEAEMGRAYAETGRALGELAESLESDSESARERARESYAELARRLRIQIARLKEQGRENIVEPLERLLEELSRALEQEPEQQST